MQALVNKLESWAQQELIAQRRMLELLEAQQAAIDSGSTIGIIEAGEAIQAHLRTGPARENRRREILHRLAGTAGVSASTLTLSSIVDRAESAGIATGNLRSLREELRDTGARVLRAGRRIAAMARFHQGLLAEMLQLLAGDPSAPAPPRPEAQHESGVLLNQSA